MDDADQRGSQQKDMQVHSKTLKVETRNLSPRLARIAALSAMLLLGGCELTDGNSTTPVLYTLGGTVSGLKSTGLVLANNGQTINVGASAVSFSFGAVLTTGASYAVTVRTQPAGATCTVSSGSGTAQGAAVGNVVVTCSSLAESLGGTISGLNGSGLVLADGSTALSVPTNATSFTLPTKVAFGSSYAVVVKTQPTGLACVVSSGSGTMPASAVTNVSVTCTDQPFSLGGSVAGLTSGGLVLANGSDTVNVAANAASFALPHKVAYGSSYAVTVQTQPTGLTCTVSNASGTMPAANVTSVAVVCADRTYRLGGSISGLTASGLVLANGTDTLAVASSATGFNLPTAIAYGSSYAVTVQTQPTGLTCTVVGGSGTMPAGNVVSVVVTCAVDTYAVGGSITGLTTSGLVLINGTDTLSVSANAISFTMPAGVASGSAYAVTVQTQPTGQLCTVANGSGTVSNSAVSSVQVSCMVVVSFTTVGAATWTVPAGVTSIQIVATGGGGGGGGTGGGYIGNLGGNGGVVTATVTVSPGDTLNLFVGGGGGAGGNGDGGTYGGGAGGGGSTNVNVNGGTSSQVIAGGGGGGAGATNNPCNGGDANGGNANCASGGSGGAGGIGGAGGNEGFGAAAAGGNGNGGAGGSGGANGGSISGGSSGDGTGGGSGGNASANNAGGGGGGFGGGGAGTYGGGGGGGGGSTGPAGASFVLAANGGASATAGGDGSIVITLNP
jgi:hypothetical protein